LEHPYVLFILVASLAGLAAGIIMHRADFCMASMFRDLFLFRDGFMLYHGLLLLVAAALMFEAARVAGLVGEAPFPLLGPAALTTLAGGVLFGIGMVLAGGCVLGSLYKFGAGSTLSGVAVLGMLIGAAVYAEWHPAWSALAHATVLFDGAPTLPLWLGVAPTGLVAALALGGGVLLFRQQRRYGLVRPAVAAGYLPPWRAALLLSLIGLAAYVFTGMPLGVTTAYSKLGATVESWLFPAHARDLVYFQLDTLTYRPPFGMVDVRGGPGPALDAIAALQYPLVAGVVLGGFLSAWRLGEFRVHLRIPTGQYVSALSGGMLLGAASRMAPGCNIWHLWGGLPVFATQSVVFLLGLLPGAWLGALLLRRVVIR
jgi:hypothetical protein